MAANNHKKFEKFIGELAHLKPEEMLERAVDLSDESIKTVPLRFRIIALGLENRQMTREDVNWMLKEKGCEKLYARSFWEATLIYAIDRGYDYARWKKLYKKCEGLSLTVDSYWFTGEQVTYGELRRYLEENSHMENGVLVTNMHTQQIESALRETAGEDEELLAFLKENIGAFSDVRERARYYFCKYLYYYLNRRIETYLTACREKWDKALYEEALAELKCLQIITELRRHKKEAEEEKRKWIDGAALSYNQIYEPFKTMFGEFPSFNWIAVLWETSGEDVNGMEESSLMKIAKKLFRRKKMPTPKTVDIEKLRSMLEKRADAKMTEGKRKGEDVFKPYMRGERDIDRTALICFLIYFSSDAQLPPEHRLTDERLDKILARCGYAPLDCVNSVFDEIMSDFTFTGKKGEWFSDMVSAIEKAAADGEDTEWFNFYGGRNTFDKELKDVIAPSHESFQE